MDIKLENLTIVIIFLSCVIYLSHAQDTFYFSRKPMDQDVVEGTETRLYCDVSNRKHIIFSWTHSGKPILSTSRRFQEGSNLRILRVTREEDMGPFQCIATNVTTGFSLQSREAEVNIQWIDPIAKVELRRPRKEDITSGVDLIFRCQISGNPEPSFLWYHNNFRLFNKEGVRITEKDARLKISSVGAINNGIYSCRAENVAGAVDSSTNFLLNIPAPNTPHLLEEKFTQYKLVLRGDPAQLDCPFVNATRIDWFSSNEKLYTDTRHTVFPNGTLYFPKVRPADEGSYRCEGLIGQNRDSTSPNQGFTSELVLANLDDWIPESFEPRLIPNFPMVIPVQNRFEVKVFLPTGKPTPTVRWLDRNERLIGDAGPIHVMGSSLIFENPQEIDSGNYTCIINNTVGEKRQNVWIIISVPPIVRRAPQPKVVEEDQSVVFSCQVSGTPYPVTTIRWQKDSDYIKLGSSRHKMDLIHGTLKIYQVLMDDSGDYACVANTTGQDVVVSSRAYLRVKKKLKFNPRPENVYLELGSDADVKCHADAEIKPVIRWIKEKTISFPDHMVDVDGTLYFRGVKRSDRGRYTCAAHSANQGFINATIMLYVVEKPRFQVKPKNTTAYEGHPVMLHCVAAGDPKPVIIWDKNHLRDSWDFNRVKHLSNGTLYVSKVYLEDRGKYGCTANNTAGSIRIEAELYVSSSDVFTKNKNRGEEEGFNMMKTIIIAVCSAGAYLALVIGLTAFCSYRLVTQRKNRKAFAAKAENGDINREQHELLMKDRDRESGTQFRSDSDNRSHVSGMSSHPSHSSNSQPQSQSQAHSQSQSQSQSQSHRSRRGSYDKLQYPRTDLQTLGMLGKGQFGDVFLAKARGIREPNQDTLVVVKALLTKDEHLFFEFRQEMDMYAKMDHPNIVKLLGVCREVDPQFIIAEYCDWGDLKQFLIATRSDNGRRIPRVPQLTVAQKLNMCNQIALGMEHLSNNRCLHKDLAARNILLTSRMELKISSLSLCRDVYASDYYPHNQTLIPLRWAAPEAVIEDDFSTKSDVWSFGVFLWEVFHLGDLPYKTRTDEELLKGLKAGDVVIEISELCPAEIIDLIRKCMSECPRDRPLFSEICITLGELILAVGPNS